MYPNTNNERMKSASMAYMFLNQSASLKNRTKPNRPLRMNTSVSMAVRLYA